MFSINQNLVLMKKFPMLLIVLFNSVFYMTSQDITVTGKVVDDQGVVLPGTDVIIKGTSKGATTNFDGEFTIDAPPGRYPTVFLPGFRH